MKKLLFLLGLLVSINIASCSKEDEPQTKPEEPGFVNPWITSNDTVVKDGKTYFKGSYDKDQVIVTKINNFSITPKSFSMTNNSENTFGCYLDVEDCEICDPETEPERYSQLLIDSVGARPIGCPLPYSAELAKLPRFVMLFQYALDGIDQISIITKTDFNTAHPAGSSLNDICSLSTTSIKSIIELIKNWQPEYPGAEEIAKLETDNAFILRDFMQPHLRATGYSSLLNEVDYSRTQWLMVTAPFYIKVYGFPSQEGNYDIQIIIKLHSGGTITLDHTLRYRN